LVSEDLESTRQASPLLVDTAAAEKVLLMTDRSRETLAKIFEDANNAMNEKPQKPMEALLAFDGLVTVGEAAFGTDSDQVVFFLTRLADIGAQYGLSSEALSLLEQRLGTFRKDFREHPIAFSTSVVLVAQLSTLTGNADHSFSVAEAEIAVFDRPTESDYRAIEFLSFALGREAMRASEPRTAERLFRRALDTSDARIRLSSSTNVNEENSRIFMRSLYLNQIGYSQILQEHFEDALPVLSEAADLAARVLPIDDPEYATRLHNLGQALAGVGRYKEAEVKVQQALTIRTKKLGEQDVKTMQTAALLKLIQDAMK
jgi:tetratricopeptide (TPR) repeat protein